MKIFLASLLLVAACARPQAAPPETASRAQPARAIYRLDFVLAAHDGASPAKNTAFTLNLEEGDQGEVLVGHNVPLVVTTNMIAPRQDVGLRVRAHFFTRGDDLLLDVDTEMSAVEAPSDIRKIVTRGNALAAAGKSTLVASLDDDAKHYQLRVTPTRLR
ncbi:MAG TPA: hypothetical protein VGH28_19165 [Polyangiaceae bacterium]|jgi:hypothetical protein